MVAMLVEARPYLYSKADKDFKDARFKSNAWDEIAKECGLSVQQGGPGFQRCPFEIQRVERNC